MKISIFKIENTHIKLSETHSSTLTMLTLLWIQDGGQNGRQIAVKLPKCLLIYKIQNKYIFINTWKRAFKIENTHIRLSETHSNIFTILTLLWNQDGGHNGRQIAVKLPKCHIINQIITYQIKNTWKYP